ncbi:MAG: GNAT family N-acetyltransferase [Bacillota bacterium]
MNVTIRPEQPEDYVAILRLTYEAFITLDYPGRRRVDEHYLIHLLQDCEHIVPELRFVAEAEGGIVGHILYTKSKVVRPDKAEIETVTFGPLSVLPKYQRQGIGRLLVEHSMNKALEMGFDAVLIVGVPDYYPKLGFARARSFGLTLPGGSVGDEFMAYELNPGVLTGGGTARFLAQSVFERAENDYAGYAEFHEAFMRENYHCRLTLAKK